MKLKQHIERVTKRTFKDDTELFSFIKDQWGLVYTALKEEIKEEEKYNGWTNYATWRTQLEVFNGMRAEDIIGEDTKDKHEIAERAKEHLELLLEDEAGEELAKSYANAFVSGVNYYEIAEAILENSQQ